MHAGGKFGERWGWRRYCLRRHVGGEPVHPGRQFGERWEWRRYCRRRHAGGEPEYPGRKFGDGGNYGGGIAIQNCTLLVTNSIVAANTALVGADIFIFSAVVTFGGANLVQGLYGGGGTVNGTYLTAAPDSGPAGQLRRPHANHAAGARLPGHRRGQRGGREPVLHRPARLPAGGFRHGGHRRGGNPIRPGLLHRREHTRIRPRVRCAR